MRNILSFAIGIVVTALALTYAFWDVDLEKLAAMFSTVKYSMIVPFLVLLTVYYWLKALRWAIILRPLGHFTTAQVTPAMMIGFGANNILPAHLGELVRTYVFARRSGKSYSGVFTSLVLERVLDVTAILLLYAVVASTIGHVSDVLRSAVLVAAAITAGVLAFFLCLLWWPRPVISAWHRLVRCLPTYFRERGEHMLRNAVLALSTLKAPRLLALILGNSLLQWGLIAGQIWLAMWAFDVALGGSVTVIVLAVTALAVAVPSAPGYIGPIQAAFVLALSPFGVAQEAALAGSVFYLVAQWIPVTLVGVVFFTSVGLGVAEVRREVEEFEHAQLLVRKKVRNG